VSASDEPPPSRHPSAAMIASAAAGVLAEPFRALVVLHCQRCAQCDSDFCLSLSVAAVVAREALAADGTRPLPASLRRSKPRDWTWEELTSEEGLRPVGPGLSARLVHADGEARLWLLRFEPGAKVPLHEHKGMELTYFVAGEFTDANGRYRPDDLREYDPGTFDELVTGEVPGLGLLAVDGPLVYVEARYRRLLPDFTCGPKREKARRPRTGGRRARGSAPSRRQERGRRDQAGRPANPHAVT
jgi:putative transcriptional regulator